MTGLTRVILAITVTALVAVITIHLIERAAALVILETLKGLSYGQL